MGEARNVKDWIIFHLFKLILMAGLLAILLASCPVKSYNQCPSCKDLLYNQLPDPECFDRETKNPLQDHKSM